MIGFDVNTAAAFKGFTTNIEIEIGKSCPKRMAEWSKVKDRIYFFLEEK